MFFLRMSCRSGAQAGVAGVRFAAATLSTSSLLCEMIQPIQDALFTFLTGTLAMLDGVNGWQANMELLTVRRGFVETPWWRRELEGYLSVPTTLAQGQPPPWTAGGWQAGRRDGRAAGWARGAGRLAGPFRESIVAALHPGSAGRRARAAYWPRRAKPFC
jgi:hypothetical protein